MEEKEELEMEIVEEKKTPVKKPASRSNAKKTATTSSKKKLVAVDLNELVEVKSCVYGELSYIARSGDEVKWESFGDVAWMTVGALMEMRNSQRDFFEKQWIVLCGDNAQAVLDYLQIDKYYKVINELEDFDKIFTYTPEEIPAVVSELPDSTKETIARRAYAKIKDGELDSKKMIDVLQTSLGYNLEDPQ